MKKNRVIICIRGGCTQEVYVDQPKNIEVIVFDVDNLEAQDFPQKQIDSDWKKLVKGAKQVF